MYFYKSFLLLWAVLFKESVVRCADDYNILNRDGSYEFGYDNPDSFHHSRANRFNIVQGQFGSRNPGSGAIDTTQYTAGPRGFRPQGKNVVRKYDLNQNGPRPIGSKDDPYFDPNEDPSYNFAFNTRTYTRKEGSNRYGDVSGRYTYVDDIGERHNVEFIAGKNTGFHVKTPFPDSNPRAYGPLYFNGRGKPIPRGRTSIQRGLDGSYRFISAGPDQRRTETSDSTGHVRGSYTYLDDKGVQHSVHYIAGPETGYRVLKNVKGPHLPTIYPFGRPEIIPSDFYDYLAPGSDEFFDTAASGHVKPSKGSGTGSAGAGIIGNKPSRPSAGSDGDQLNFDNGSELSGGDDGNDFGRPGGSSSGDGHGFSEGFGTTGLETTPTGTSGSNIGAGSRPGISRPGGNRPGISRPFSGGSRPQRPSYDDDDGTDPDLFGATSSSSVRPPGGTFTPPSSTYGPPGTTFGPTDGTFKPQSSTYGTPGSTYGPPGSTYGPPSSTYGPTSNGESTDDGSYKPTGDDGSYRPGTNEGRPGSDFGFPKPTRPTGGFSGGSKPYRPNYDDVSSNEVNDFNLFDDVGGGSGSTRPSSPPSGPPRPSRPPSGSSRPPRPPSGPSRPSGGGQHIGISYGDTDGRPNGNSYDDHGTIVTNVGDRLFSVPPGVSVRAHVQAIDLLPLGPRTPTPGEQLKAESKEEFKAETSNIDEELHTDASSTSKTITLPPTNATKPIPL